MAEALAASLLVVDDDDETRELLAWALRHRGHEVACAANGEEALGHLRDATPVDVIILDFCMPRMGGREFLEARTLELQDTPVVVLSASDERTDLHGMNGVVAILSKPCDVPRLLALIDAVLRSRPR